MRPLETLLLAFAVAGGLALILRLSPQRRSVGLGGGVALAAFALHALLEGVRWHMFTAFGLLALSLIVLWHRGRSAPTPDAAPAKLAGRMLFGLGRFVLLPGIALLSAALPATMPVPSLPEPTGEHEVGVSDFVVRWDDRPEILTARPDDVRELLVRVWYPASVGSGPAEPYMTRAESDALGAALGHVLPGGWLVYNHARLGRTHSFRDTALVDAPTRLPVLVFSHGYSSFLSQNTPLMEELASHGYVVFSLAHTYDSSVVFPDGRVFGFGEHLSQWMKRATGEDAEEQLSELKRFIQSPSPQERRTLLEKQIEQARSDRAAGVGVGLSWDVWVEDRLRFFEVLEQLESGARPSRFERRLDLDRLGLLGMSFGGATAAEVCHRDERCRAAVNLDGGHMYGVDSALLDGDIGTPLLMLHSSELVTHAVPSEGNPGDYQAFSDFHYEPMATRGSREDVVRLRIAGTSHLHISDLSLMVRWIPRVASRTPGPRIAEILNRYVLAFFDEHLRQRPSPLLDGPVPEFPEISFQTFGRPLPAGPR